MARKTEAEMFVLMNQWEESGTTQAAFCEAHQITLSTFSYWRGKYLKSTNPPPSDFVKLAPEWPSSLEVVYPNGVKVCTSNHLDFAILRALIQLI